MKIRKIIGHKSQTYGGAHGLHYCYDYSLSGPINDLLESVAYCYTDFLDYSGFVQTAIRDIFKFRSSNEYFFPEIRSMGGAIFVMSS